MKTEEEYNAEVLQLMRDLYPTLKGEEKERAERLFPQLKESEDKRMKRVLTEGFTVLNKDEEWYDGVTVGQILAWFEKQGEKGVVLRDTFGYEEGRQRGREEGIMLVLNNPRKYGFEKQSEQILANSTKTCKNEAWSEEDEEIIDEIIDYMLPMPIFFESTNGKSGKEYTKEFITQATIWLKSLKERYTWKPSNLPHWKKSTVPNDTTTDFNSDFFCYNGYDINYKELFEKLPKDD